MTWRELLEETGRRFREAGIGEYDIDAWYLLSETFGISRAEYFLCRDRQTDDRRTGETQDKSGAQSEKKSAMEIFRERVNLRCRRIPLQQIVGHQEFMGLDFFVNEHVLIPRQDTEVLVETVLNELKEAAGEIRRPVDGPGESRMERAGKSGMDRIRVLDMCAGSGCIGISLERMAPVPLEVLAADISDEAVKVAQINCDRLGCEHYQIIKSDLFAQVEGDFDVIVSNPPYIPSAVIETLDDEVRLHEPRLALDGEDDGLTFYRRISEAAAKQLTPGGRIYYEIGYDQGKSVSDILAENGFTEIRVIKDLAGLDRVAAAKMPG